MNKLIRYLLNFHNDFDFIFFKNEFKALSGIASKTIMMLTLIVLLTILALGFAIGSIENLQIRMDNPFTNWIDMPIDNQIASQVEKVQQRYAIADTAATFNLQSMVSFGRRALTFYKQNYDVFNHRVDTLQQTAFGRTIEVDEAIFTRILDERTDNVLWLSEEFAQSRAEGFSGCEIIISVSLMKSLGFERSEDMQYVLIEDDDRYFLKVVAVLKELPGRNDFIISPVLYNVLEASGSCRQELLIKNEKGRNDFIFLLDDINQFTSVAL